MSQTKNTKPTKNAGRCPECFSALRDSQHCPCGWEKAAGEENTAQENTLDGRCYFTFDGFRCPLPGGIAEGSKNNHFLCSAHWFARRDLVFSKALLQEIRKDPRKWERSKKDWRVELLEEKLKKVAPLYKISISNRSIEKEIEQLRKKLILENK
jgi:hypothetical protein